MYDGETPVRRKYSACDHLVLVAAIAQETQCK